MATLAQLLPQVRNRLEEQTPSVFWDDTKELLSGLTEAQCEAVLLIGRPSMIANVPLTIQSNTCFQTVPKGMFVLLSLQGPASEVWKITLEDMDYSQVSDSGWEQDVGDSIQKWGPLGFSSFFVWPAISQPQTVLATGIASPITGQWPYSTSETVLFHDEEFSMLEKYAASYARLKESGAESQEGVKLYEEFLSDAKNLTRLQDRVDPYLFNASTGGTLTSNPTTQR